MSGKKDTWDRDIMLEKLKHLDSLLEKHAVAGLMQFANKKGVNIDIKDMEALNQIISENPITYENLTEEQQELINRVYGNLKPTPQWNFNPKGGKRRRKSRKKTKKRRRKSRKKTKKRRRRRKRRRKKRIKGGVPQSTYYATAEGDIVPKAPPPLPPKGKAPPLTPFDPWATEHHAAALPSTPKPLSEEEAQKALEAENQKRRKAQKEKQEKEIQRTRRNKPNKTKKEFLPQQIVGGGKRRKKTRKRKKSRKRR